jgi:hypothetical protein
MQERASTPTKAAYADLPSCCGTGCAVCVLDLIGEYAAEITAQAETSTCALVAERAAAIVEAAECCNTGCLICLRDYPELFRAGQQDEASLQLLEAIEQAQQTLVDAADRPQTF